MSSTPAIRNSGSVVEAIDLMPLVTGSYNGSSYGPLLDRHLRLALLPLAGPLLPRGVAPVAVAWLLHPAFPHGRAQRQLLPRAEEADLAGVAQGGARGLPLRRQGQPLHHPRPAPQGERRGPAALSGRSAPSGGEAGACPLPATARLPLHRGEPAKAGGLPAPAASRPPARLRVPPRLLVPPHDL